MKEFFESSVFFPVFSGIVFYLIGDLLRRKFRTSLINPLLVSVTLTILMLVCFDIEYASYASGAKYLSYLLTPATVCLAIPLYRQLNVLQHNKAAILAGIVSGAIVSLGCVFVMSLAFGLSHGEYVSLLPKSITTAIGISLSEEFGGNVSLTAVAIIITGIFGNVSGEFILKLFRIKDPVAKGVALGTASHAIGTTKALELGETEGAVSALSIVVAGIITTVCLPVFTGLI